MRGGGSLAEVRGVEAGSGSLDAAASEVFVGRQDDLALLDTCLDSARGGSLNVVLIEGAAGIGKSALLRTFLQDRRGIRVLWASGDEAESGLPFGVIDQLLPGAGFSQAETGLERGVPDRISVGARLVELFGGLQTRCPLVVVVDDAHWADRPSLVSLTFALRRLRTDRVLAIVTVREGCLPELPESLQRLSLDRHPSVVSLAGLPATDVRELAVAVGTNTRPSLAMAERLREHTGGNPLHVRALLAELPAGWSLAADACLPSPRSYSLLVLHRLAACPQRAQELVIAAAVLGVRCTLPDAARLAAIDEPLEALEAAMAADLLEAPAAPANITFTHPLVRAAVYHDIGPARRAALHARAAIIIGEHGGALRHRVASTVGEDQALACELAVQAREEAARGSLTGAARTMLAAARLAGAHEREALLLEGVELLVMSGDTVAAGMATQVEATADSPRRSYVLGLLALQAGRWAQAEKLLADAWRTCLTSEPELGTRIAGELARLSCLQCRGQDAVDWALRAVTHDDASPGPAPGILDLAVGLGMSGLADEGLTRLQDLPEAPQVLDPPILEGLVGRGMLRLWSDDLIGARRDLSRSAAVARERGPAHLWMLALGQLAEVEYRAGNWDAAVTHSQAAVSAAADAEQVWLLPYLHTVATVPFVGRGQWEQATAQVRGATETARMLAVTSATCCAAVAEATLCLGQGHHQAAVDALEPLRSLLEQDIVHHPGTLPWAEINVEALVALGRLDEAEAMLRDFETLVANGGRRSAMIDAARLRGLLLAAGGRAQPAEAAFRHGLAQAAEVVFPFHQARLESALGQHLMQLGKHGDATDLLRLAHERFGQLGALPHLRQCERQLLACGSGPARRAALKGAALTPQELTVATLVCSGRTNREVAAELVLSVKTIEFHLGNAYAKLGVTSRTQLCAKLVGNAIVRADERRIG